MRDSHRHEHPTPPSQVGRVGPRWYAGFEGELHEHHTIEDTIFFPSLFERVPSLRGYLDRIDDEHRYLTELIETTRRSLVAIADPEVAFTDAVASVVRSAEALADLLDTYLDFEDAEILPLFERHYDAAEYKELDARAVEKPDLGQLKFTVPWLMASGTAEEQQRMFDGAPFAMKVLWWATRRRYARLEAEALGADATVATVPTLVAA